MILIYLSCSNLFILKDPVNSFRTGEASFSETKETIASSYVSQLGQKYWFINLNGLFVRLTGGRVCNKVVILKNGMLTDSEILDTDPTENARKTAELSKQLEDLGIKLLYVQIPAKMDLNNDLCPRGIINKGNKNADLLISELEKNGVSVLDLRTDMADTPEHISRYFYKTDHHWNPLGAFRAFQEISAYLQNVYPDEKICGTCQDLANWELHQKEKWFLGSRGKRTGTYFAGVDDLIWLTPKFNTGMSFANVYDEEFFRGDFCDANIREDYLKKRDYFDSNPHRIYAGGNYPLVKHRNPDAPSDKRILMVKDSFALPLEAFISTIFKEVDVIDMRYYETGSLDTYISDSMPDMVLMGFNAYLVGSEELFGTGADTDIRKYKEPEKLYEIRNLVIKTEPDDESSHIPLYKDIKAGNKYTLKIDEVAVSKGKPDRLSFCLYDPVNDSTYNRDLWDLDYCIKTGSSQWTFTVPADVNDLELTISPTAFDNASDVEISLSGIELYRYPYQP